MVGTDVHARIFEAGFVDQPAQVVVVESQPMVAEALSRAAREVPILLVEQNLQVVRSLADTVVVLESGRTVYTGSAASLLDDEALTQRLLGVASAEDAA